MKKTEWLEKEKVLTDELITDILFHKEEIGEVMLLKRALNLVTNHLELVSYCIDKEREMNNLKLLQELTEIKKVLEIVKIEMVRYSDDPDKIRSLAKKIEEIL